MCLCFCVSDDGACQREQLNLSCAQRRPTLAQFQIQSGAVLANDGAQMRSMEGSPQDVVFMVAERIQIRSDRAGKEKRNLRNASLFLTLFIKTPVE